MIEIFQILSSIEARVSELELEISELVASSEIFANPQLSSLFFFLEKVGFFGGFWTLGASATYTVRVFGTWPFGTFR